MPESIIVGHPPIEITLRRTPAARRLSLRVSRLDGRVSLTAPPSTPTSILRNFALSKETWVTDQVSQTASPMQVSDVSSIPYRGKSHLLRPGKRSGVRLEHGQIIVPAGPSRGPALRAWLREQARAACLVHADGFAAQLGRSYTKLTLRDTRSRWGSCSNHGSLMLSWRLIMAPDAVLRYVVGHEVAHLQEMNHSAAFWRLVAELTPDFDEQRDWLRAHGCDLHRYRFGD